MAARRGEDKEKAQQSCFEGGEKAERAHNEERKREKGGGKGRK